MKCIWQKECFKILLLVILFPAVLKLRQVSIRVSLMDLELRLVDVRLCLSGWMQRPLRTVAFPLRHQPVPCRFHWTTFVLLHSLPQHDHMHYIVPPVRSCISKWMRNRWFLDGSGAGSNIYRLVQERLSQLQPANPHSQGALMSPPARCLPQIFSLRQPTKQTLNSPWSFIDHINPYKHYLMEGESNFCANNFGCKRG